MPRPRTPGSGRKSKGERELLSTRTHPALAARIRASADEQGLSISDYLSAVLAGAHGLPEYAPVITRPRAEQQLPLSA